MIRYKSSPKSVKGYTLVELLIVIVIVGVLAAISVVGFGKIQADSRDKERHSNAVLLSEALEKYYEKNGEYPSVAAVTDTNVTNVKTKLGLNDADVLVMPKAPAGTVTSITATEADINKLAYNGQSVNASESTQCQSQTNGGCDQYKLQWVDEQGIAQAIDSRHSGRDVAATLSPPSNPVLTLSLSSGNILGTVTAAACTAGTIEYRIVINTSATTPNMTVISWQSGNTTTLVSPVNGTTYYGYAMARCVSGTSSNAENPNIATDDYTYTPAGTPSMLASWSGTSAVGTASVAPACGAGLTTKYYIEYKIDTTAALGSWTVGQNWTTTADYTIANANTSNPRKFNFRTQVRCDNGATQGAPSAVSNTDFVISAPQPAALTNSSDASNTYWSWPTVACPMGTTVVNRGTWTGDYNGYPAMPASISTGHYVTSTTQGFTYGMIVTSSCGNTSAKILAVNSANSTYYRPMAEPLGRSARSGIMVYHPAGLDSTQNYMQAAVTSAEVNICPSGLERRVAWSYQINLVHSGGSWTGMGSDRAWPSGTYQYFQYASDFDDEDGFEVRFGVRCRNPVTGQYSTFPSGSYPYEQRHGNLVITSSTGSYHVECSYTGNAEGSIQHYMWCYPGYTEDNDGPHTCSSDSDCWSPITPRDNWTWNFWDYSSGWMPVHPDRPACCAWGKVN